MISAGDSASVSVVTTHKAFERALEERLGQPVDFVVYYLGLFNEDDRAREASLARIIGDRVTSTPFDVVVAHRVEALALLLRHRSLLRGLPLVFTDVTQDEMAALKPPADVTGAVTVGTSRTASIALHVLPDTERFVIVGGETAVDRRYADEVQKDLSAVRPPLAVVRLDGRPLDEQLERIRALPPKSLILFRSYLGDASGRSLPVSDALEALTEAAQGPIFGFREPHLGSGIVGGDLERTDLVAVRAAALAARILGGESPSSLPRNEEPARVVAFDARQLERFGIAERRLPPGSEVRFRPPTIWTQYRRYVLGAAAVLFAQTLLILGLVVQRRGRQLALARLAEAEHRFRTVADFAADWEYWIAEDGSPRYVSPSTEAVTGYAAPDFVARPEILGEIVLDEDREAWRRHREQAAGRTGPSTLEFRIRTRDGRVRWIEHVCSPVSGPDGSRQGTRASNRDVTERKQAEEDLRRALRENEELRDRLEIDNRYMLEQLQPSGIEGILGTSDAMRYVTSRVQQVAPTASTVLLLGETGVGKSLLAQAIHDLSPRRARPLVTLNCAALPPALVESELFGHAKGAFSGAGAERPGRFEAADGGTLFLDEVAELPLDLQAKLLRAVQDGAFERVGSSVTRKTDVRLIAATNRKLEDEVRAGRFRQDLLYRLAVFPITVPPLRQRPEDVPALVGHLLEKHCRKLGVKVPAVSRATMKALQARDWPGNIRELENVVERLLISSRGARFELGDDDVTSAPRGAEAGEPSGGARTLAELERDHVVATLERLQWRIEGPGGAADVLGINASTLRSRMRKQGIRRPAPGVALATRGEPS